VKDDMVNDGRYTNGMIVLCVVLAASIVAFALYFPVVNHEFIEPAERRVSGWLRHEKTMVAENGDTLTATNCWLRSTSADTVPMRVSFVDSAKCLPHAEVFDSARILP
jgi:hypothetical protein